MDREQKRSLIGGIGVFLGSACVSYTVDQLVKANTSPAGRMGAIAIKLGGMILSGMVASKSEGYISDTINQAYGLLDGIQGVANGQTEVDTVQ